MRGSIKRGEIRLDTEKNRPVKIGNALGANYGGFAALQTYRVRDILTGKSYFLTDMSIGRMLSEMEVIAWVASET